MEMYGKHTRSLCHLSPEEDCKLVNVAFHSIQILSSCSTVSLVRCQIYLPNTCDLGLNRKKPIFTVVTFKVRNVFTLIFMYAFTSLQQKAPTSNFNDRFYCFFNFNLKIRF